MVVAVDRSLLGTVVASEPLAGHDGRSGASLTRVWLPGGDSLVVKRCDPSTDLAMRLSGDVDGRELGLWTSGALDELPDGVGHAVVGGWREGDEVVTVMRDLGDSVLAYGAALAREECRRIFRAAHAVHTTFRGRPPAGVCTLRTRLRLFAPAVVQSVTATDHPIVGAVLDGWDRFGALVPPGLWDAVSRLHQDPGPLVDGLLASGTTLVHADLWPVNVALTHDEVVVLDWALATEAPAAFEYSTFLMGAADASAGLEELMDDIREAQGSMYDDRMMGLALLASLVDLGWNLALDATRRRDDGVRERARSGAGVVGGEGAGRRRRAAVEMPRWPDRPATGPRAPPARRPAGRMRPSCRARSRRAAASSRAGPRRP